jgi:UDP-N-acetylglucosamine 2-epimerase (non-hydrolysing)
MQNKQSFLLCMGTRPEIIKMAPVYHELVQRGAKTALLHTGQHKDLAQPMYDFFGMRPDYSLLLNRTGNTLEQLSSLLIERIGSMLSEITPRAVLVHGDTTTALMAALAAFYQKIPVAHVEAGLRSGDHYDPFPEEMNRQLISRIATWHFSPTAKAADNLTREGIPERSIRVVGNSVVDAVAMAQQKIKENALNLLEVQFPQLFMPESDQNGQRIILVTAHRRENWDGPMLSVAKAVRALIKEYPNILVVWPVHANPIVKQTVHSVLGKLPRALANRVLLVESLSYPSLLELLSKAWLVLTDSGGIQEEAATLHVPILVLRKTTERPELVEAGAGRLVGTHQDRIIEAVRELWDNPEQHAAMRNAINPFGDGTTARQIADTLFTRHPNVAK